MKIIKPTPITPDMLVSSSITEDDYPAWNAATAYSVGTLVIRTSTHKVYERLNAGTTATAPEADPINWLDRGATNRWRMFDKKVGTVSSATTSFNVTLVPGICNAMALIGIRAGHVRIVMTDAVDGVVFDRTYNTYDPIGITSWYAWCFEDVRRRDTLVVTGLPSYRHAQIEVTLSDSVGATVSIGALIPGRLYVFGKSINYGAGLGIQDYSRKEKDDSGNFYLAQRPFARKANWDVLIAASEMDYLQKFLSDIRATPAVYIGDERYGSSVIYGWYRDFSIVISYPFHSECSIELEGLT